jgi:hypothetical protein
MKWKFADSGMAGQALMRRRSFMAGIGALVCGVVPLLGHAEGAAGGRVELSGIYQVITSNDPYFSLINQQEWFLDFSEGMKAGKLSGSVAISLRKNPHVKVRMMAWQYFSEPRLLVIGSPYHEGSKRAVAGGAWAVRVVSKDLICERDGFQMTLRRAIAP